MTKKHNPAQAVSSEAALLRLGVVCGLPLGAAAVRSEEHAASHRVER
jgi:hypothetical protein